jgi:hypothetical protein
MDAARGEKIFQRDPHCVGCYYYRRTEGLGFTCDYIIIAGESRGCPPGAGCLRCITERGDILTRSAVGVPDLRNPNYIYLEIDGVTKNLSDWAAFAGISRNTLYSRYYAGLRGAELLKQNFIHRGERPDD